MSLESEKSKGAETLSPTFPGLKTKSILCSHLLLYSITMWQWNFIFLPQWPQNRRLSLAALIFIFLETVGNGVMHRLPNGMFNLAYYWAGTSHHCLTLVHGDLMCQGWTKHGWLQDRHLYQGLLFTCSVFICFKREQGRPDVWVWNCSYISCMVSFVELELPAWWQCVCARIYA